VIGKPFLRGRGCEKGYPTHLENLLLGGRLISGAGLLPGPGKIRDGKRPKRRMCSTAAGTFNYESFFIPPRVFMGSPNLWDGARSGTKTTVPN